MENMFNVLKNGDIYNIEINSDHNCNFFNFIINTSNFFYRSNELTLEQQNINKNNLLLKLSALGYIFSDNSSERKGFILSNISNDLNCFGKSLLLNFIKHYSIGSIYTKYSREIISDYFFYRVNETTSVYIIDEASPSIDYRSLSQYISGGFVIKRKYQQDLRLEYGPKLIIATTDCSICQELPVNIFNILYFSNYYNLEYSPRNDFGLMDLNHLSNDENILNKKFIDDCITLYKSFGIIEDNTLLAKIKDYYR